MALCQCFNCEQEFPKEQVVGLMSQYYCDDCLKESMSVDKNGGLPIINYHYFHFIDQDYLDQEIDWNAEDDEVREELKTFFAKCKSATR